MCGNCDKYDLKSCYFLALDYEFGYELHVCRDQDGEISDCSCS